MLESHGTINPLRVVGVWCSDTNPSLHKPFFRDEEQSLVLSYPCQVFPRSSIGSTVTIICSSSYSREHRLIWFSARKPRGLSTAFSSLCWRWMLFYQRKVTRKCKQKLL